MHAGGTLRLFPVLCPMAEPWQPCRMRQDSALTTCHTTTIASLIVSPDEALRSEARCPLPQCRVTDDLLTKAYDTAAHIGRIGNSLSHLMLALSASLQQNALSASSTSLSDGSLSVRSDV